MVNSLPATSSSAPLSRHLQRVCIIPILLAAGSAVLHSGCSSSDSEITASIQKLKKGDADVRVKALEALEERPDAIEAIPHVVALLNNDVRDVRYRAAKVLSKIEPDATTVPALATALKDPDVEIRYYIAKALSRVGPDAEAAVPALIEALADGKSNDKSTGYVIKALQKIGPKALPAVPTLKKMSQQHPSQEFRKEAAHALNSIEKKAAETAEA